jgi:hypothetical protein
MPNPTDPVLVNPAGARDVIVTERVLVSLNNTSSDVQTVTTYHFPPTKIPPDPPKVSATCDPARTWTFSGRHETGADGTISIEFSKFLKCVSTVIEGTLYSNYIGLPHFVATPLTDQPCFLSFTVHATALHPPPGQAFLPPDAQDVSVRVKSWNHDGTPAPKITLDWIAIARLVTVTNF